MIETRPSAQSPQPLEPVLTDPELGQAPGATRRIIGWMLAFRRNRTPNTSQPPIDTLDEVDRSIPNVLDDYLPDGGQRYQRPKELRVANVRHNTQAIFNSFEKQHGELTAATDTLFRGLVAEPGGDTAHIAHIDHLLAGYPNNIMSGLGGTLSADSLLAVIRTGNALLGTTDEKHQDPLIATPATNYDKGVVAKLLADKIPRLVAAEGTAGLERIKAIAAEHGTSSASDYIEFRLKYGDHVPVLALDPEAVIGEQSPDSPFTREDADHAWKQKAYMGIEQRQAVWADLAQMAAITDRWNHEYGLSISQGVDGSRRLVFIRGVGAAVKNKTPLERAAKVVFFHSHPQQETADGLLAPLISPSDIRATGSFDGGGGYYNIACKTGVTLQIGSQPAESDAPPGWTVESGDLRGATISSNGGTTDQNTVEVMRQLLGAGAPFVYSINTKGVVRLHDRSYKITFIHIPWKDLDASSATLDEVCFGDGLPKILARILPAEIGEPDVSLNAATQKAKHGR